MLFQYRELLAEAGQADCHEAPEADEFETTPAPRAEDVDYRFQHAAMISSTGRTPNAGDAPMPAAFVRAMPSATSTPR